MVQFSSITGLIDGINERVGRLVAWSTCLLVGVTFVDVVMRYFFNTTFVFTQELEWHVFAFLFLMGAGYTLKIDGHVRVEVFYGKMSKKGKAWIDLIGVLFFLIPSCALFVKTAIPFVLKSYAIMEGSPDPGGIPFRFVLKACIPAGYALILLQGISLGIKSFATIINKPLNGESAEGK